MHQHPAGEIIIAREGSFDIKTDNTSLTGLRGVFIPANVRHCLRTTDAALEITLFERPSGLNRLIEECNRKGNIFTQSNPERLIWQRENLQEIHNTGSIRHPIDDRVLHCKMLIDQSCTDPALSTQQLASVLFLSPGRLNHLFKEQLGVSIQKYILWARTREAVSHYLMGKSNLQAVALQAGFFDPAHFSRAFRNFFGEKPSFAYNSQSVQDFPGKGT